MGLFTRKVDNSVELAAMHAELASMKARLDEADAAKARLAHELSQIGEHNAALRDEVSTLGSSVVEVRDAIATSTARVDELDQAITPLSEQPAMAPPTIDPLLPPHGPTMDELATKLADVTALVAEQQQHLANVALVATDAAAHVGSAASPDLTPPRDTDAETRAQVGQLAEKVASIDSRLHQISLELTNQLTELSNDIDAAALQPGTPDSNAVLEEIERLMAERIDPTLVDITDGQERLATEQARYAISFREDLADLADKLAVPRQR